MSYLAFGVFPRLSSPIRESIGDVGIQVHWADSIPQPTVFEMLGEAGLPRRDQSAFLVTQPNEDTSDGLISPYNFPERGIDGVLDGVRRILQWLSNALPEGGRAELWLTEGYDDRFEEIVGKPAEVEAEVLKRVQRDGNVPSLRIVIEGAFRSGSPRSW